MRLRSISCQTTINCQSYRLGGNWEFFEGKDYALCPLHFGLWSNSYTSSTLVSELDLNSFLGGCLTPNSQLQQPNTASALVPYLIIPSDHNVLNVHHDYILLILMMMKKHKMINSTFVKPKCRHNLSKSL